MSLSNENQPQLLRDISEDDDALLDAVVCSIIDEEKDNKKLNNSDSGPVLELNVKPEFQREVEMVLNEEEPELTEHGINNDCNYWNDDSAKCPRSRSSASDSSAGSSGGPKKPIEYETDPAVLARRQKDIDYGKNTIGYDRYTQQVPKIERTKDHPKTPPMYQKYSRRGWDGMVRLWRKQLHYWDPPNETKATDENDS